MNEKIEFKFFDRNEDIEILINLSHDIWMNTYLLILPKEPVEYLFDKIFNYDKIKKDFENDSIIWIKILINNNFVGFISLFLQEESIFISKFYVHFEHHRKGIFKTGLNLIEQLALNHKKVSLRLNVNKKNDKAILIYEKYNFKKVDNFSFDIGNGYIMNDFIMEKSLLHLF